MCLGDGLCVGPFGHRGKPNRTLERQRGRERAREKETARESDREKRRSTELVGHCSATSSRKDRPHLPCAVCLFLSMMLS